MASEESSVHSVYFEGGLFTLRGVAITRLRASQSNEVYLFSKYRRIKLTVVCLCVKSEVTRWWEIDISSPNTDFGVNATTRSGNQRRGRLLHVLSRVNKTQAAQRLWHSIKSEKFSERARLGFSKYLFKQTRLLCLENNWKCSRKFFPGYSQFFLSPIMSHSIGLGLTRKIPKCPSQFCLISYVKLLIVLPNRPQINRILLIRSVCLKQELA